MVLSFGFSWPICFHEQYRCLHATLHPPTMPRRRHHCDASIVCPLRLHHSVIQAQFVPLVPRLPIIGILTTSQSWSHLKFATMVSPITIHKVDQIWDFTTTIYCLVPLLRKWKKESNLFYSSGGYYSKKKGISVALGKKKKKQWKKVRKRKRVVDMRSNSRFWSSSTSKFNPI